MDRTVNLLPLSWRNKRQPRRRLTMFGRSLLLISCELIANSACWIACGVLFGKDKETRSILGLAVLAWTIGLRHGLDADHIRQASHLAIDNATRGLIGLGQVPVTCGLFFSLGHSTIVIVVNVAIVISTDVYDKIGGVGDIGGIVGTAVSGSFLFLIGLGNSIVLWKIFKRRRQDEKRKQVALAAGLRPDELDIKGADGTHGHGGMLMTRLLGPVLTSVNRPWKMYIVGVLFGFGFDTASSIALLAISAIGRKASNGTEVHPSTIVMLPLLFTAGMTLVDSLDSILMLYSYTDFSERSLRLFEPDREPLLPDGAQDPAASEVGIGLPGPSDADQDIVVVQALEVSEEPLAAPRLDRKDSKGAAAADVDVREDVASEEESASAARRRQRAKQSTMSSLSLILTLISILLAFSISLIEIMGLIGSECHRCEDAAKNPDGGGLAGRWWRFWAAANDNSGYIGAAIVGMFAFLTAGWYVFRWALRRRRPAQGPVFVDEVQ